MTRISTPFTARSTAAEILAGVDLSGRHIIVTGGGSGLGRAAAEALRHAGAEVVTPDRRELDLADLDSVRAFTEAWTAPVDGIIANAGIMAVPERRLTAGGWELQLATNFLGHFALITGLHDSLRAAAHARIVVVSSGVQRRAPFDFTDPQFASRPYDPWVAYAQSKVADVLLAVGITRRWAGEGITANAVMPGWVHTNLQRDVDSATMRAMGAMDENGDLITPDFYKTPQQGAATSVLVAASPLLDGVSGRYFEDNQEVPVVPAGGEGGGVAAWSVDPAAADRLWDYATATVMGL